MYNFTNKTRMMVISYKIRKKNKMKKKSQNKLLLFVFFIIIIFSLLHISWMIVISIDNKNKYNDTVHNHK